jgi:hypothetical protein
MMYICSNLFVNFIIAVRQTPIVNNVFVFKRTSGDVPFTTGRDVWMADELPLVKPYCPCEPMDSEGTETYCDTICCR